MIPRIFPVVEHRRSGNLYIGTVRGLTRLHGSELGGWFASGPSYCGASITSFELRGIGKIETGPMPSPTVVLWCAS